MLKLSFAEQIAQFDDAAPVDFDPEALNDHGMDEDVQDVNFTAAIEHFVDETPSTLRNLQASVADPKYDGVRVSRKALFEDAVFENGSSDEYELEDSEGRSDHEPGSGDSESSGEVDEEEEVNRSEKGQVQESKTSHITQDHSTLEARHEKEEDILFTMKKTQEEDRKKGKAVAKQMAFWDALLDARIRLQKSVVAANKLPQPAEMEEFLDISECSSAILKFLEEALLLTDDLLELEERLLTMNESISPPPRKRRKVNAYESPHQFAEDLISATESVVELEHIYHPHLLQVLSKWSSKIQAVSPSVLLPSNRGAFTKSSQYLKSAVQLVDEALLDQSKLLSRTRVSRSKGSRIGSLVREEGEEIEDVEIFDDNDFYQKLLRDIIDSRGDEKGGSNDWMAVQKQKKARKKVDMKASKGRKLHYEAQDKIQNFMVPVPVAGGWHDEQIDELFASLLGKGFKHMILANEENIEENQQLDDTLQTGFRVFG